MVGRPTAAGGPELTALVAALPRLRRYARVLTGDPGRADDLVTETLRRASRQQQDWRHAPSLRTWLFTLMHNLNGEQPLPSRIASARIIADARHVPARPAEAAGTELSGDTGADAMLARILRLPAEEREALVLVAVEGLSYAEIASLQRVSIGTVLATLTRAREAMRQMAFEARSP